MLKFTPQQVAENTIIDQIILETALGDQTISVNQFKGAVVVDPNLGNYVVIDFTVTDTTDMYIGRIRLMHGQTPVAISDDKQLLIVKEANKNLKIRLAAQFEGAEKCKFNTTSVNLPYATPFREGVVRFTNGDEINKSGTVYSAKDVDDKIDAVTGSLGDLKDYAKKTERNEFIATNMFRADIIVSGEISGNAVATKGIANEKDTLVVSLGYANDKYLSKTDASSTYLTQTDASDTYLKKTDAEAAANNYAKLNANNEFAAGTTNTFNDDVTVKGIFAVGESQDAAVLMVSGGSVSGTAINSDKLGNMSSNMLPTEGAVVQTITDAKSELDAKDNDLQSQIDGINAGQNLADIVNNTTELAIYDVSHLKAKDDFQHGSSGAKWAIGDKVQVLGGGDTDAQSCVYELIKGAKPEGETDSIQSTNNAAYYWHYIGVYGTNAYTKAEIDEKVNTINNTLGTKANKSYVDTELGKKANSADVYSKTDADTKFAQLAADNTFTGDNTFSGAIFGDAVTSDIATDAANQGVKLTTSRGVSNFVTKVVDAKITELQGGMPYLKLNSDTLQTVESPVLINGTFAVGGSQDTAGLIVTDHGISGNFIAEQALDPKGTRLPTESAVVSFVNGNRDAIAIPENVGAMGLFLYTGGDFKSMTDEVDGTSLKAVGMQLPMDGVVSWSQGAAMPAGSKWKLLNNTIAGEPCLVLAICTAAAN